MHFYRMMSSLPNSYGLRNAPDTLPRQPLDGGGELWLGGRFGMMRACVDVYRMLMMTFRSLGTHLPLHHLAVTELPIQITSDQVTFPE